MLSKDKEKTWGQENFGEAKLRDKRRTRSLVDIADRILAHPGGSLPDKLADPLALDRCYTLMNAEPVTHAAVMAPHQQLTRRRICQHPGVVLNISDATELDFTSKTSLHPELGILSDKNQRGYICHNVLAVDPLDRSVFGFVNQILHVRHAAPEGETVKQKRDRENRESRLWWRGLEDLPKPDEEAVAAGCLIVDVCDGGADTFEFMDFEDRLKRSYVIRAGQDRCILVGHDDKRVGELAKPVMLFAHMRSLKEVARRPLEVPARDGCPMRETEVALAFAAIEIQVPTKERGIYRAKPLKVWAVRIWEINPPEGVKEPVEWVLLTPLPTLSVEQGWQRADWYECRWVVEELHKVKKTGCAIEAPQFTTAAALQPMIALLSVVAVALLNLRELSRNEQTKDNPAEHYVPMEYAEVLSVWRYKENRQLTVREFYLALARLGGHQNRKSDHPPGWIVLWRGWTKLHLMLEGARAARRCQSAAHDSRPIPFSTKDIDGG
jgi:Transposase DNA-binding